MKRKKLTAAAIGMAILFIISNNAADGRLAEKARHFVGSAAALQVGGVTGRETGSVRIQAEHAIVIDSGTGKVLFAKNDKAKAYPASTTKILTALVALEVGKPDERVTVGPEASPEDPEESRAGLRPGQQMKLYDLVAAALLPSGNDAARVIAVHIGRKSAGDPAMSAGDAQREFVKMMNKRAKEAGAVRSSFVNATGLHDPNHYTTARDMGNIAAAAMSNPLFRQAAASGTYTAVATEAKGVSQRIAVTNRNQLLQPDSANYFEGATGIKTGFTDQAGYCLVSSASRGGRQVIAVVLKSTNERVYPDTRELLEDALAIRPPNS